MAHGCRSSFRHCTDVMINASTATTSISTTSSRRSRVGPRSRATTRDVSPDSNSRPSKPGGLVVDYLGLAQQLQEALAHYTEGDREETGIPQEEAVLIMQGKYEVVAGMLHGFDYYFSGFPVPPKRLRMTSSMRAQIRSATRGCSRVHHRRSSRNSG